MPHGRQAMRDGDGCAVFFKAGEGALNGVLTFRVTVLPLPTKERYSVFAQLKTLRKVAQKFPGLRGL
jgi:hypothetical protein